MIYKHFIIVVVILGVNSIYTESSSSIFNKSKKNTSIKAKDKTLEKEITIIGIDNKEIMKAIKSQISAKLNNPTIAERNFWIQYNTNEIYKVLYSFGYFDAEVKPVNAKTIKKFEIKLNQRYKFKDILCVYNDYKKYKFGLTIQHVFDIIEMKPNQYITTKQIANGLNKLKDFYKEKGFAFVNINKPDIQIDKKNKTIKAIYYITLNKKIIINNTIIKMRSKKDPKLLEPFVRSRITWKKNEIYDIHKINNFKEQLVKYDLFANIDVSIGEPIADPTDLHSARADIIVNLEEAPLRSVNAEAKFSTSDLLSLSLGWTHHNIDGKGSTISILGSLAKSKKELRIKHNYYDIFTGNQHLETQIFGLKEDTDSYTTTKIGGEGIFWQHILNNIKIGLGGSLDRSKTIDKVKSDNVKDLEQYINTFGIPIRFQFDNTDSETDPQKGVRFKGYVTPYFSAMSKYTSIISELSTYISINTKNSIKNKFIIALYSKYGTIFHRNTCDVPRDKLYFAGGANSVRGYGYQKIGSLNEDRTPTGGDSVFEARIEPRIRVKDSIGITVFLEAGKVFNKKTNKRFKNGMMYGYGVGMLYYTPLAPLRINLAFPTKRRKDNDGKYIDSLFHVYLSIGQAF